MTATVSYTPTLQGRLSSPSLRMSQALAGSTPALLADAWWPCSCHPRAEPPSSTALLDPQTTPVSAVRLMAAVSDPLRTSATGRLMAEAARLRTVAATDRAVEVVWDAEGGREARGPTSRPRIPAVTAPVVALPAAVLPTPHPAKGR